MQRMTIILCIVWRRECVYNCISYPLHPPARDPYTRPTPTQFPHYLLVFIQINKMKRRKRDVLFILLLNVNIYWAAILPLQCIKLLIKTNKRHNHEVVETYQDALYEWPVLKLQAFVIFNGLVIKNEDAYFFLFWNGGGQPPPHRSTLPILGIPYDRPGKRASEKKCSAEKTMETD